MKPGVAWPQWLGAVRDLLFPPVCAHCGGLVGDRGPRRFLCARCAARVLRIGPPHCPTCGYPFFGDAENRTCEHCFALSPRFGRGRAGVLLRGPARTLAHAIKYHGQVYLVAEAAALALEAPGCREHLAGAVLVPVPLHPRKERERGYNQAAALARAWARAVPGTRVVEALRRVVDTPTQTRLDRRAREENLKNAFAMAPAPAISRSERIVLVDDVFTTGATLNACAVVLRRHGCLSVDVATFGHG
jgi:competence protein ComFC